MAAVAGQVATWWVAGSQVTRYLDIFERLRARAVTGRALAALVEDVASSLDQGERPQSGGT